MNLSLKHTYHCALPHTTPPSLPHTTSPSLSHHPPSLSPEAVSEANILPSGSKRQTRTPSKFRCVFLECPVCVLFASARMPRERADGGVRAANCQVSLALALALSPRL